MSSPLCALWLVAATALGAADEAGFVPLFDGRSPDGWQAADMSYWSIDDGAITGQITAEHPCTVNQYLIWQGGDLADFELKLAFRIFGSPGLNGGFQFRSRELPDHDVAGYQVDNNLDTDWSVRLYDEHGRHTLAMRGLRTVFDARGRAAQFVLRGNEGPAKFRLDDWHEYHLTCVGPRLSLQVNGLLVAEVVDRDPTQQDFSGILALQLHSGPPTVTQFKDIRLKKLPRRDAASAASESPPQPAAPHKAPALADKTLVAWLTLANRQQRGGGALTIQDAGEQFDSLVFGEIAPGKWMPGSDLFRRTPRDQSHWPLEAAGPAEVLQMALVYRGKEVIQYRNGVEIGRHTVDEPKTFAGSAPFVVIGLRHLAGASATFAGAIEDARIYDAPLDAATIARLRPNEPSDPPPLGWWDFENGSLADRRGAFPPGRLHGAATVKDGKLLLPGGASYFSAGAYDWRTRESEQWPIWHVTALPSEGVGLPYDANGCIYWKGRYHLMYIYQDAGRPHGGHCWGHASSADLVNWTFHPPAIVPAPGDPDVGIFSGNAFVNKDGVPMLCWFGINAGVCVATAEDDELLRWKKHPANPIVPIPQPGQPGHGVYTVWDPFLWLEGDTYYCLLGGNQLPNKKDTLYLCESADLVHWQPRHAFYEHPDLSWTTDGEDCSCPDFFKLGDKHVLLCISHKVGARAYIGRFENQRFYPEQHVRMNWPGGTFFAPESLLDAFGRRIFWAWVTDPRLMRTQRATGSGYQSLPRVLSLAADGTPRIAPAEELAALRTDARSIAPADVPADGEITLGGIRGDSLEVAVEIEPGSAREVGLALRATPDGTEEMVLWYDPAGRRLVLDMSRSTMRTDVAYSAGPLDGYGDGKNPRGWFEAPLDLPAGEPLRLRAFVDKSLVEVFANDRQCLTQQIYPDSPEAQLVKVYARGGPARIVGGQAWKLKAARFVNEKDEKGVGERK